MWVGNSDTALPPRAVLTRDAVPRHTAKHKRLIARLRVNCSHPIRMTDNDSERLTVARQRDGLLLRLIKPMIDRLLKCTQRNFCWQSTVPYICNAQPQSEFSAQL
jgi:hypothetical protein